MNNFKVILLAVLIMTSWLNVECGDLTYKEKEEKVKILYNDATLLMNKMQYSKALKKYEKIQELIPNIPNALYNGGLAAYLSGEYEKSATLFYSLHQMYPGDYEVIIKMVQVFEALNDFEKRDVCIDKITQMWKSGKVQELKEKTFFCRDQFQIDGQKFIVFDYFELNGDRAIKYSFCAIDKDQEIKYKIILGSDDITNSIARESGDIGKDERLYNLEGYFGVNHSTYGFYKKLPSYNKIKETVQKIVKNEISAISSSGPKQDKPE